MWVGEGGMRAKLSEDVRTAGLAERIERETEVPVKMSNVPLEAVVLGAGHVIEHYEALKGMFMGARR